MPPQGSTGRYYGASAEHRRQIRAALRLAAKQAQVLRSKAADLERTIDTFRDRATLPNPSQLTDRVGTRWQTLWSVLKATEKTITDLFELFV